MTKTERGLGTTLTLLVAACLYPLLRAGQVLFFPEPDPAAALYDVHAGYFWRILIAAYGAGLLAPLLFWFVRRAPERATRLLPPLVTIAAALLVAQAVLLP